MSMSAIVQCDEVHIEYETEDVPISNLCALLALQAKIREEIERVGKLLLKQMVDSNASSSMRPV